MLEEGQVENVAKALKIAQFSWLHEVFSHLFLNA